MTPDNAPHAWTRVAIENDTSWIQPITPEAVAGFLAERYGEVVLKLGEKGALWARKGHTVERVTALPVKIVDSTGAGDAFCAGFLAEWLKGATPKEALAGGARLGAGVVSQVGARPDAASQV